MGNKNIVTMKAKKLDNAQLKQVLPDYKNIIKQIDEMRVYAKEKEDEDKNDVINVFALLGKRGAGKSSILLTIKEIIKEKQNNTKNETRDKDIILPIVLPIILPNRMDKREDIMGWLLGSFEEIVKGIEEIENSPLKSYNGPFNKCRGNENNNCIKEKYNEVLKQYGYTKRQEYEDILKDNFSGFNEYIDKTKRILNPENNLKESFFDFINELITYKKRLKFEMPTIEEPMVFIFLDDIDLTKSHCKELLEVIPRYLCHPNIVTFISGDYDIFETEQFLSLMQSNDLMSLIVSPSNDNKLGERLIIENEMLAKDTLKKLMPPTYRYKLKTLSPKERLDFYYKKLEKSKDNEETGDNEYVSKSDHNSVIKNSIRDLLQSKFKRRGNSFKVINSYGLMFDDMPRGIMNVYKSLNSLGLLDKIKDDKDIDEDYIMEFKNFIDVLIRSSSILSRYEDEIKACIQINDKFSETFFNHERLIKQIDIRNNKYEVTSDMSEEDKTGVSKYVHYKMVVLIFTHFIESIVKQVNTNRKIHGSNQVHELIEQINKEDSANNKEKELGKVKFNCYPKISDIDITFDIYELMLSNDAINIMDTMDNLYLKDFSLKFYFEQLQELDAFKNKKSESSEIYDKERSKTIKNIANEDSKWLNEKFEIIYYHKNYKCMYYNKAINEVKKQCYKIWDDKKLIEELKKDNNEKPEIGEAKEKSEVYKEIMDILDLINVIEVLSESKDNISCSMFDEEIYYKWIEILNKLYILVKDKNSDAKIDISKEYKTNILEELKKVDKNISDYFSKINISTSSKMENEESYIIVIAIIVKVIKEIVSTGDYENEYFEFFDKWHESIKDVPAYKKWIEDNEHRSPLTLILEKR